MNLAGDDPVISLVNAMIMHRLIPRSQLHSYHGGHLDLATDAQSLAPVVEVFLTAQTAVAHDGPGMLRRWRDARAASAPHA